GPVPRHGRRTADGRARCRAGGVHSGSCLTQFTVRTVKDKTRSARALPRRDRALAGRADQCRVLGQGTRLVAGLLGSPVSTAALDLCRVDVELDAPGRDVHPDGVTILDQADETANFRLGGDVADAHPGRPSGEAPVGDEQHVLAETRSLDGAGDLEHLPHPGTTLRALGADDDYVTGLDLVVEK